MLDFSDEATGTFFGARIALKYFWDCGVSNKAANTTAARGTINEWDNASEKSLVNWVVVFDIADSLQKLQ